MPDRARRRRVSGRQVDMTMLLRPFTKRALWRFLVFVVMLAITWILFGELHALLVGCVLNFISIEMLYKQFRDLPRFVEQIKGKKDGSV